MCEIITRSSVDGMRAIRRPARPAFHLFTSFHFGSSMAAVWLPANLKDAVKIIIKSLIGIMIKNWYNRLNLKHV